MFFNYYLAYPLRRSGMWAICFAGVFFKFLVISVSPVLCQHLTDRSYEILRVDRTLAADERPEVIFSIAQGTLPWQPVFCWLFSEAGVRLLRCTSSCLTLCVAEMRVAVQSGVCTGADLRLRSPISRPGTHPSRHYICVVSALIRICYCSLLLLFLLFFDPGTQFPPPPSQNSHAIRWHIIIIIIIIIILAHQH